MKHLFFLLLIIGTAFTTSCATTDTSDESDTAAEEAVAAPAAPVTKSTSKPTTAATEAPAKAPAKAQTSNTMPANSSASASDGNNVTYTCTHDGSVRTIRVLYHATGPMVCEVTYEKASGTQSLWSAANDDSYCAPKAQAFVAKQEGWGWSCNQ